MYAQSLSAARRRSRLAVALLAVLLLAGLQTPLWAQPGEEQLLYEEDLEDGDAQGWALEEEGDGEVGWIVEEGMLRGLEHYWAVYEPGEWLDSRLEVTVTLGNPFAPELDSEGLNIIHRLSDAGRYIVTLNPRNVSLTKQLGFGEAEEFIPLGQLQRDVRPGVPHLVSLAAYGDQIAVVVDGEPLFEVQDPEPLPPGTIALETLPGGYARVDAVRVYGLPAVLEVYAVEPQRLAPGDEVMLDVFGATFLPGAEVQFVDGGLRGRSVEVVDSGHLRLLVAVDGDAAPGWRELVVTNLDGQAASYPQAVEVVVGQAPPPGSPALYGLEPAEVEQGGVAELVLGGESLTEGTDVVIGGPGVQVESVRWIDASQLAVRVRVDADAPPGPRGVEVRTPGGTARLPEGLFVVERPGPPPQVVTPGVEAPPPTPPAGGGGGGGGGLDDLLWGAGSLTLAAASYALGRGAGLRSKLVWTEKAHLQWHVEAQKDLPNPQRACQWGCKASVSADFWDRWHVKEITLTAQQPKGHTIPPRRVTGDVLQPLDDLSNWAQLLRRQDEAEISRQLAPIVSALLAEIQAWGQAGQSPPAIRVDAQLEAPIHADFGLHHCRPGAQGLEWTRKPLVRWKSKLHQPAGQSLGILRGPTAGEPDFAARAGQELEACLRELIRLVRLRP